MNARGITRERGGDWRGTYGSRACIIDGGAVSRPPWLPRDKRRPASWAVIDGDRP